MVFSEEPLNKPVHIWVFDSTTSLDIYTLNSVAKILRLYPNRVIGFKAQDHLIAERYNDRIAIIPEPRLKNRIRDRLHVTYRGREVKLNFQGEDDVVFQKREHDEVLRLLILRAIEHELLQKGYLIDERKRGAYKYIFASQYINGLSTELFEVYMGMTLAPATFPSEKICEVALRVDAKCMLVPRPTIQEELALWRKKRCASLKKYAIKCNRYQWAFDSFGVYDVCPLSPRECPSRSNPFKPCKLEQDLSQPKRCNIYRIDFSQKAKDNPMMLKAIESCPNLASRIDEKDPVVIIKFREAGKEYAYPPMRLRRIYHTSQVNDLAIVKGMDKKRAKRERSHASKLVTMKPWVRFRETKRQLDELRKVPFGEFTLSFQPLLQELEVEGF